MENKDQLDKVDQFSPSLISEQIEHLKKLFPGCFAEGEIDFEKLREALGEVIEGESERYHFTWTGKRDADSVAASPYAGDACSLP